MVLFTNHNWAGFRGNGFFQNLFSIKWIFVRISSLYFDFMWVDETILFTCAHNIHQISTKAIEQRFACWQTMAAVISICVDVLCVNNVHRNTLKVQRAAWCCSSRATFKNPCKKCMRFYFHSPDSAAHFGNNEKFKRQSCVSSLSMHAMDCLLSIFVRFQTLANLYSLVQNDKYFIVRPTSWVHKKK